MKKTIKLWLLALALCLAVAVFTSCEDTSGAEVSEEAFREALSLSDKNLTMEMHQVTNGSTEDTTVRFVDGKVYMKSSDGQYWDETTGNFNFLLDQFAECYTKLSFAEGVYTAESLMLKNGADDEFEATNISIKINSKGNLIEVYFDLTDGEQSASITMTFSKHGSTKAPSGDEIGGSNSGGTADDNYGKVEHDPFFEGTGSEVDEKKWQHAFDILSTSGFYAEITMSSPDGNDGYQYVLVDGSAYYTSLGKNKWVKGAVDNFTEKVSPFAPLFSDVTFIDGDYVCEESTLDIYEGAVIRDLHIVFDDQARLVRICYNVDRDGAMGRVDINISTYDRVSAPNLNSGSGSGTIIVGPGGDLEFSTDTEGGFDFVIVDPNGNIQIVPGTDGSYDYIIGGSGSDDNFFPMGPGGTETYPSYSDKEESEDNEKEDGEKTEASNDSEK